MVAFIQKAHGCIFLCYAIEAQAAQLAISNRFQVAPLSLRAQFIVAPSRSGTQFIVAPSQLRALI